MKERNSTHPSRASVFTFHRWKRIFSDFTRIHRRSLWEIKNQTSPKFSFASEECDFIRTVLRIFRLRNRCVSFLFLSVIREQLKDASKFARLATFSVCINIFRIDSSITSRILILDFETPDLTLLNRFDVFSASRYDLYSLL